MSIRSAVLTGARSRRAHADCPARPSPVRRAPAGLLAAGCLAAAAAPLVAQAPAPPARAAAAPVVLRAARLLDVTRGAIVSPGVLVIEGDRIRAVGPGVLPAGATMLDLGDVTLLPGLIDMHTHLTGDPGPQSIDATVKESPADAAMRGVRNARVTLRAGFTTVRDVGAPGFSDIALMRGIERGDIEGPRMFPAGNAIGISGGHCDDTGYRPGIAMRGPLDGIGDGVDEVVKAERLQIKYGAKVVKVCATAGVFSFDATLGAQQLSDAELRAIVEEANRHGLRVAAHAHGTEGIKAAVRAGVASIEHGSILDDEAIRLMKERGTYLVPTAWLHDYFRPELWPPAIAAKGSEAIRQARASHRRAIAAGVKVAFGTDAAVAPHGLNAKEFAVYVSYGMTPAQAIRTATVNAADLLGVTDRGVLAAGTLADVIAVPGNPLDDVRLLERVTFVMKGGAVVVAP